MSTAFSYVQFAELAATFHGLYKFHSRFPVQQSATPTNPPPIRTPSFHTINSNSWIFSISPANSPGQTHSSSSCATSPTVIGPAQECSHALLLLCRRLGRICRLRVLEGNNG